MSTENRNTEFADKIIENVFFVSLMFVYFTIYKRKRTDRLHTTELKSSKYGFQFKEVRVCWYLLISSCLLHPLES